MNARESTRNALARFILLGDPIPKLPTELIGDPWARKVWVVERRKIETMDPEKRARWAEKRGIRGAPDWATKKRSSVRDADSRFYREMWYSRAVNGVCRCEECGRALTYSAAHVSHNLSRGAWPQHRHNPRNVSILCVPHHRQWETGDRQSMAIYPAKAAIMDELRKLKILTE